MAGCAKSVDANPADKLQLKVLKKCRQRMKTTQPVKFLSPGLSVNGP